MEIKKNVKSRKSYKAIYMKNSLTDYITITYIHFQGRKEVKVKLYLICKEYILSNS